MQNLIDRLNYYTKLYNEGKSPISDKEWDDMYFQLQQMEKDSRVILPGSPTQSIKYEVQTELKKVKHNHLMLSADKTKNWDNFVSYFGIHDVVGMLKLDGLTCSLRYVNGDLVSAETRGNGTIGEDVLHNAKVIRSIPKHIDYTDELIIDGEIICRYQDFEPFSNEYANPRNFASGSIRLLDSKECAARNLTFVAWYVVKGLEDNLIDNFNTLQNLGFTVVPWTSSFDWDAKDFLVDCAKELGYPIDGLVGRFTSRDYGESLGNTDHHTKAIYAYKFYDEEYETELLDIEWTMGRTGQITPVAIYKAIEIEGSVCSRASLHNVSIMDEILGIPYVGQPIKVFKANAIIPQISQAEIISSSEDGFKIIEKPCKCPICGGDVDIVNNEGVKTLVCINSQCEGKLINRMDHFFGKKGLDIKGLSKATFEKLIDAGLVTKISDVFTLERRRKEWEVLPGFGAKSVASCLTSIQQGCITNLTKTISAAGIPLIGTTVAKDLSKRFKDYNEFRAATKDEKFNFSEFGGYGYEMNKALKEFNYDELDYIVENFLTIEVNTPTNSSNNLENKVFVITGKSSLGSRDKVKQMIEAAGGKVASAVSNKTNYLLANAPEDTTKYHKAEALGIPIINDDFLRNLLK